MPHNITIAQKDITWFLDLSKKLQLDLDPPYQRWSVWSIHNKKLFIDTILNNYPTPPIFLHETQDKDRRSTYHVIDGKQRLKTIFDFSDGEIPISNDFHDINLRKKRWEDLSLSTRRQFWNYILIVVTLPDTGDLKIKSIFERFNRNTYKLTNQEMRHAQYDGWLIKFVEAEAKKNRMEKIWCCDNR